MSYYTLVASFQGVTYKIIQFRVFLPLLYLHSIRWYVRLTLAVGRGVPNRVVCEEYEVDWGVVVIRLITGVATGAGVTTVCIRVQYNQLFVIVSGGGVCIYIYIIIYSEGLLYFITLFSYY